MASWERGGALIRNFRKSNKFEVFWPPFRLNAQYKKKKGEDLWKKRKVKRVRGSWKGDPDIRENRNLVQPYIRYLRLTQI